MSESTVSVLIPVMNEVSALNKTIEIIESESPNTKFEIIIILSPLSEKSAVENAYSVSELGTKNCRVIIQKDLGIGGAYIHGIEEAKGDYILMIASDLETDPHLVKQMLMISSLNPEKIITTTRWQGEHAGFKNYGSVKLYMNWIFQKWIALTFKSKLTDFTFGFRLYPSKSIKKVNWQNLNFAFLLEVLIRPIKSGWEVVEIPHFWQPRTEGVSSNRKRYFFAYFKVAVKVRFGK